MVKMNKVICLITCFSFAVFAQSEIENTEVPAQSETENTEVAAQSETENTEVVAQSETGNTFLDRINIGIKLGVNFPSIVYSSKRLDDYQSSTYATGLFELFGEYSIIPSLSVLPGIKYTTRGQHLDVFGFKYEYNVKFIELTLPVAYTFPTTIDISPYVIGGPVIGIVCGGDIRYSEGDRISHKIKLNKSNSSSSDFGLYFGSGLKYNLPINERFLMILGFEAGYHLGLTNKYSDKEHNKTAKALNADDYNIEGTRKHRGLELGITFALPLASFKKLKQPEPPPPVPEPELLQESEPEQLPESEPEKPNHTVDEITNQ